MMVKHCTGEWWLSIVENDNHDKEDEHDNENDGIN